MRLIARSSLAAFWETHPTSRASLEHWVAVVSRSTWRTPSEVQAGFSKARVLNAERVRFEVAGGDYRLIVAFKFEAQIAFVKFIGTHSQYDAVDALTVSLF